MIWRYYVALILTWTWPIKVADSGFLVFISTSCATSGGEMAGIQVDCAIRISFMRAGKAVEFWRSRGTGCNPLCQTLRAASSATRIYSLNEVRAFAVQRTFYLALPCLPADFKAASKHWQNKHYSVLLLLVLVLVSAAVQVSSAIQNDLSHHRQETQSQHRKRQKLQSVSLICGFFCVEVPLLTHTSFMVSVQTAKDNGINLGSE